MALLTNSISSLFGASPIKPIQQHMAKAHAARVDSLLGELTNADKQALARLLDGAKSSIRRTLTKGAAP